MRTETATKTITASGDSLVINVTKEVKRLGLDRGDDVAVTLAPTVDKLDFIRELFINAIASEDLEADDGRPIATVKTIEAIYRAVGLCAPSGFVIGYDHSMTDYQSIDVFTEDNTPLLSVVFKVIDHY